MSYQRAEVKRVETEEALPVHKIYLIIYLEFQAVYIKAAARRYI